MKEHPIPQDVTGYRFHLIGNMTLKQFAELGAGCFLGFLFYNTNLVDIIKWPLIVSSVGLGAMVAFVPFEERPLDHWVVTFFKILYKPTKYFWKRKPIIPKAFTYKKPQNQQEFEKEVDLSPARRARIEEYLSSVEQQKLDPWEVQKQQQIAQIMGVFDQTQVTSSMGVEKSLTKTKPKLKTRIRTLKIPNKNASKTKVVVFDKKVTKNNPEEESLKKNQLKTVEQKKVTKSKPNKIVITNKDLPFPSKPKEKNKIVGMVVDPENKLIAKAIIQIKNQQNQVVRAVKTNSLGQFYITTPLSNGSYVIQAEKEGEKFEPQRIDIIGEIVDPLEIRSVR
jgi:hypothetical protein